MKSTMTTQDKCQPSVQDLTALHSLLHEKSLLTDKSVMIPFTTKAFFPGSLQPRLLTSTTEEKDGKMLSKQEEMVMIHLGQGYFAEVKREYAANFIQRRVDLTRNNNCSTSLLSLPQQQQQQQQQLKKKSVGFKKGFLNKKETTTIQKSKDVVQTNDEDNETESILPFIEIREEYDSFGKELKTEAIHVADNLKCLRNELRQQSQAKAVQKMDHRRDGNDELSLERVLLDALDMGESSLTSREGGRSTRHERRKKYNSESLTSRLDELARLEEEAERNQTENVKSSRTLQGNLWKKGFYQRTTSPIKETKKEDTAIGQKSKQQQPPNIDAVLESSKGSQKTVSIQETNNTIQEIPPFGHQSVRAMTMTAMNPISNNKETNFSSFPQSVLKDTVVEHTLSHVDKKPSSPTSLETIKIDQIQQQQQTSEQHIMSLAQINLLDNKEMEPKKKKLSRFAQQRQQQQQYRSA